MSPVAVQSQAQAEFDAYIDAQAQAIAPEPILPAGYTYSRVSEMFGTLHRIYQGSQCIGTFGKVGTSDRYWINSKLYHHSGTFATQQEAANALVKLWAKDCPAIAA